MEREMREMTKKEEEILEELKKEGCFSFSERAIEYYIKNYIENKNKLILSTILKIYEGDEKCLKEDNHYESYNFKKDSEFRLSEGQKTHGLCTSEEGSKIEELFKDGLMYKCFVNEIKNILKTKLEKKQLTIEKLQGKPEPSTNVFCSLQ